MDQSWVYAQQSVLGACLIDDSVVGRTVFGLGEGDFLDINKTIYRAMRDLYTSGKTVDPVTVLNAIGGEPDYRRYIAELMEITPTSANIDSYIGICRERSRVARYRALGEQLTEVAASKDGAELISAANSISVGWGMQSWTMGEALKNFFQRYDKRVEYLPWFLEQLNGQLDLEPGDFCLLGGRPSSGKSAFALEAAIYWAAVRGYRVGFYSCETSREKLTNRLLAACARVPLGAIKHSRLDDRQLEAVCDVSGRGCRRCAFPPPTGGKGHGAGADHCKKQGGRVPVHPALFRRPNPTLCLYGQGGHAGKGRGLPEHNGQGPRRGAGPTEHGDGGAV